MTERDRGILECAAEARRRADEYLAEANRIQFDYSKRRTANSNQARAKLYKDFAEWCEREAGTYPGASRVVIGL